MREIMVAVNSTSQNPILSSWALVEPNKNNNKGGYIALESPPVTQAGNKWGLSCAKLSKDWLMWAEFDVYMPRIIYVLIVSKMHNKIKPGESYEEDL